MYRLFSGNAGTDAWTDGHGYARSNARTDGNDARPDAWTDARADAWTNARTDAWTDARHDAWHVQPGQMPGQPQAPAVAGVKPSVVAPPVKEVRNTLDCKYKSKKV